MHLERTCLLEAVQGRSLLLVRALVRWFQLDAAAFYDSRTGEIAGSGANVASIPTEQLRAVAHYSDLSIEITAGSLLSPVRCAGSVVGSLGVRGSMSKFAFRKIIEYLEAKLDKDGSGYRLEHSTRERMDKKYLADETTIAVSQMMKDLIGRIG